MKYTKTQQNSDKQHASPGGSISPPRSSW